MADKKFGMRVKLRRMQLGLTQTQLAKKIGESSAFISDVEQGISFPRYERLIKLIDGLETSSDVLFQDVIKYPFRDRPSLLSDELRGLPPELRKRVLDHVEFTIWQYKMDHADDEDREISKRNICFVKNFIGQICAIQTLSHIFVA